MEFLNANDIFPGVHYKDNTQYQLYSNAQGTCPNAFKISNEIISLPLHVNMSDSDVNYVIDKVVETNKIINS
jgi:dTDP-4-amino-4,6-dideoxygalactose transaminase